MGYSPDAYVQMAIQLAIYILFKEYAVTYEATFMRPFLHRQIEITRTVSPVCEAFVKRMGLRAQYDENDSVVREEKLFLLRWYLLLIQAKIFIACVLYTTINLILDSK